MQRVDCAGLFAYLDAMRAGFSEQQAEIAIPRIAEIYQLVFVSWEHTQSPRKVDLQLFEGLKFRVCQRRPHGSRCGH